MKKTPNACIMFVVLFLPALLYVPPGFGQDSKAPRISIEDLKTLLDQGAEIDILDTHPKPLYDIGHIKDAISLPYKEKLRWSDVEDVSGEPPIVIYCDCGPGEADS